LPTSHQSISALPEAIKKVAHALPVRRSQMANWAIDILRLHKPFVGRFMGMPMEVHPLEAASRSAYFLGFYEREVTIWALEFFKKQQPQMIFDVGANFGYLVYLAQSQIKNPTIYGFEPDPYNYIWLKKNLELMGAGQNVKIEKLAVSDRSGTVRFVPSNPNSHENLWAGMSLKQEASTDEIEVPSISLDQFCTDKKIEHVDLVKMDIEGGEAYATNGMLEGLKKKIYKNILLELHPQFLSGEHSSEKIMARFLEKGYHGYHFVSPFAKKQSHDKIHGFYNMTWDTAFLKPMDKHKPDIQFWEHVLFTAEPR
jgi:FkbM family methyltransferase